MAFLFLALILQYLLWVSHFLLHVCPFSCWNEIRAITTYIIYILVLKVNTFLILHILLVYSSDF